MINKKYLHKLGINDNFNTIVEENEEPPNLNKQSSSNGSN